VGGNPKGKPVTHPIRQRLRQLTILGVAAASAAVLAACGGGGSSSATASSAKTSGGPAISTGKVGGNTVLVDSNGMTLYALSVEKQGHFICTDKTCLSVWHPVKGKPSGSVGSLGTVTRPDGTVQAAYKGKPLYTFAQDMAAGDAKGEGFKDVGVWHAVTTSGSSSSSSGGSSGGGGGYSNGGY
jgi:predicted lipoprotein with Yx(FWY)xxD motif